ncbi:hypothetical protein HUT06_17745 [Actinomadura sp. NAK00032]|uniref:hypothetical protein n=1 Tax=Actinomadura sp. NAK00032 TaxID=2742128 RepID=UPI001591BAD6|nr:hypothetical protein [Actinomadura sp. NAK00032]QKW35654.1 hypothetical protein HUT06_17745 [Actinomadura sp. NAK00032]
MADVISTPASSPRRTKPLEKVAPLNPASPEKVVARNQAFPEKAVWEKSAWWTVQLVRVKSVRVAPVRSREMSAQW